MGESIDDVVLQTGDPHQVGVVPKPVDDPGEHGEAEVDPVVVVVDASSLNVI